MRELPRKVTGSNSALATRGKVNKSHPIAVKGRSGQRRKGTNTMKKG